jgi:hypothetical protein
MPAPAPPILGRHAPPPRLTPAGAALLALALALPGGAFISLITALI